MGLCADRLCEGSPVADCVLGWTGDPRPQSDNVPLRLAGALHALRLEGLALADVYPPHVVDDDTLWAEIEVSFVRFSGRILHWLKSAPQTNEVRRAAVILPAMALFEARFGRPIELIELGASAGLNLYADQFYLQLPEAAIGNRDAQVQLSPVWTGPPPPTRLPEVVARRAVDLNPLDASDPSDQLRLLAYLWPDQPDRLSRTRGAIDIAMGAPAQIDRADAGQWLAELLERPANVGRLVFHTVAWQYFPPETRAKASATLSQAGARATEERPLAHLSMEADGGDGASVKLTMWPGGENHEIARCDFHGRWVNWTGL